MNPVQALSRWTKRNSSPQRVVATSSAQAIHAWSRATGIVLAPERTIIAEGVRDMLSAIFSHVLRDETEVWLPNDVYPVYWQLAADAKIRARGFSTLPQPDWHFLTQAGEYAAVVLPIPLSPLGRLLTDAEARSLMRWLSVSTHRLLIVDAVYTFDFEAGRPLLNTLFTEFGEQCVVLWSCSKSWLSPGLLGLAAVPHRLASILQEWTLPPTQDNLSAIRGVLESHPDLCRLQQEAFVIEWQRLMPEIHKTDPDWLPPSTGYFSVVNVSFTRLLNDHGILSVPATVFGATKDDFSIVTCLHDLAAYASQSGI